MIAEEEEKPKPIGGGGGAPLPPLHPIPTFPEPPVEE
tara:strand:+ start:7305 stop:7415 length:111 start_codon:yes stop_codon:yes gene_type:complete